LPARAISKCCHDFAPPVWHLSPKAKQFEAAALLSLVLTLSVVQPDAALPVRHFRFDPRPDVSRILKDVEPDEGSRFMLPDLLFHRLDSDDPLILASQSVSNLRRV